MLAHGAILFIRGPSICTRLDPEMQQSQCCQPPPCIQQASIRLGRCDDVDQVTSVRHERVINPSDRAITPLGTLNLVCFLLATLATSQKSERRLVSPVAMVSVASSPSLSGSCPPGSYRVSQLVVNRTETACTYVDPNDLARAMNPRHGWKLGSPTVGMTVNHARTCNFTWKPQTALGRITAELGFLAGKLQWSTTGPAKLQ